jgi:hypothetical protein
MQSHLEMNEIFRLAMAGEHHEHLDSCAFCHAEYEDALEYLKFEASSSVDEHGYEEQLQINHQYRLAAQDSDATPLDTHVRRTWYLENGTAVLRVMEDPERGILYGHLIIDTARYANLSVRFSGIKDEFHPDQKGIFEIGSTSIEIERMDAILIEA